MVLGRGLCPAANCYDLNILMIDSGYNLLTVDSLLYYFWNYVLE